jgi:isopentenyl-diphosphate delta-isomerase type 1
MVDELLDIVNEENTVVGQEWRSIVHRRGLWHRGVDVFLFTREGKLLVQQRSKDRDVFPSALDSSVAEHLKAGEDYLRAAIRGLKEELGIEGIALRPVVEFRMSDDRNDNEFCRLYEGIVEPAAVHFDQREVERIVYHTLPELRTLMDAGQVAFSYWFTQLLRWYLGEPSALRVLRVYQSKIIDFQNLTF